MFPIAESSRQIDMNGRPKSGSEKGGLSVRFWVLSPIKWGDGATTRRCEKLLDDQLPSVLTSSALRRGLGEQA